MNKVGTCSIICTTRFSKIRDIKLQTWDIVNFPAMYGTIYLDKVTRL